MKTFTVKYERDESGWWVAQVQEQPAAITQGRTITEARRRIREALAVVLDNEQIAQSVELVDDVRLPLAAKKLLRQARADRQRAELDMQKALTSTTSAVRTLTTDIGLSVRDTGDLLGISHQRVQQLVASRRKPRGTAVVGKS